MSEPVMPATPQSRATRWRDSGWWYLVFLINMVIASYFDPRAGVLAWSVTIAVIVVFVPLYLLVTMRGGRLHRWSPWIATAIGVAAFPLNGASTVLFVYAAAFAATSVPRRLAYRWFVGLSALTLVLAAFGPIPLPFALIAFGLPVLFVWVIGLVCIEEVERDQANAQLRIDNARIEHLATATERERLARDLHDMLGQSLTEVIVRTQLARRLGSNDPARAETELAEIERAARRALDEVRGAVRGWSEVRIDEELDVARRGLEAADIVVHVERDPEFDPPPTTETALALALREATTNVLRHAAASSCRVELRRIGGDDVLQVADDGRGGQAPDGNGLTGMRERVAALGGAVERRTDAGTTLTVRLPAGVPA